MAIDTVALLLSRLQFGLTAGFHYLFVPLTLGLVVCIAAMDTLHARSGAAHWRQAARWWSRFFVLGWLAGVATGYPLRMQLQQRWAGYSEQVHDILRTVMAAEGWIAPAMLTLVLLLAFGGDRIAPRARLALRWTLAALMLAQATAIVTMNAWMQHPVGTLQTPGGHRLVSLADVFLSPTAIDKVGHTLSAALLTGALFIAAVSALSIARRRHLDAARASLKLALPTALAALALVAWSGHASMRGVMQQQPMKFAAMEAHWERGDGPAALTLFALPDSASGQNRSELQLPYLMSWLATHSNQSPAGLREGVAAAEQRIAAALRTPGAAEGAGWRQLHAATAQRTPGWNRMAPAEQLHATALAARPDVPTLFFSFRLMIGSGVALAVLLVLALRWRAADAARGDRRAATLLCIALPLPWIATLAGWTVAEVGRQPWVVYEQMTTLAAVRLPPRGPVVEALAIFVAAYTLLGSLFAEITRRLVLAGPEGAWLPARWRMRIRTWRCGSPGDESLAPASRVA